MADNARFHMFRAIFVLASVLLLTAAAARLDWVSQIENKPLVDVREYPGSDIGAKINAAYASLPAFRTGNGPTPNGVILLPAGSYSYSTPIVVGPLALILGQGTVLTYTGTGTGITFTDAPTSYTGWGGMQNVILFGSPGPGAVGIQIKEATRVELRQVRVSGFTAGVGILWHNVSRWGEQVLLDHILLDNNAVGQKFWNDGTAPGIGGNCYSRWRSVEISVPSSGTGVLLVGDALVTGDFEVNFFLAQGATALHLQDKASIPYSRWMIRGELTGRATAAFGLVTDPGTTYSPNPETRWWYTPGITDRFATGTRTAFISCNHGDQLCLESGPARNLRLGLMGPSANHNYADLDFSRVALTPGKARTYTFPDASGTVPLLEGQQTWTESQYFNGPYVFFGGQPFLQAKGTSDSAHNYGSFPLGMKASFWNGSTAAFKQAYDYYVPDASSGANPQLSRTWNIESASGGARYVWLIDGVGAMALQTGADRANKVVCWKSDGVTLGHCSTAPDSTGECRCK